MQRTPAHRKLRYSVRHWEGVVLQEGASVIGHLTTVGRVSGRPHRVTLRLVYYRGGFYASRRDAASDWCRNLIKNPSVSLQVQACEFAATASLLNDDELARKISSLKYQDERAGRRRVIVEIIPTRG